MVGWRRRRRRRRAEAKYWQCSEWEGGRTLEEKCTTFQGRGLTLGYLGMVLIPYEGQTSMTLTSLQNCNIVPQSEFTFCVFHMISRRDWEERDDTKKISGKKNHQVYLSKVELQEKNVKFFILLNLTLTQPDNCLTEYPKVHFTREYR